MSMSKKDFIALADHIRNINGVYGTSGLNRPFGSHGTLVYSQEAIEHLANFLQHQNPAFMRERWLDYIAGECGPNGGSK